MHLRRKRPVDSLRAMNIFIILRWRRNYLERYLHTYIYHSCVRPRPIRYIREILRRNRELRQVVLCAEEEAIVDPLMGIIRAHV